MSLLATLTRTSSVNFHSAAGQTLPVPIARIGGLPIAVIDRSQSAKLLVELALNRRGTEQPPLIITSANGQVLSLCARRAAVHQLFLRTDLIQADGMSLVFGSRLYCQTPLPERICTTDFFHDVAEVGQRRGARMFFLGGTKAVSDEAVRRVKAQYPGLDLVGHASGYIRREGDEAKVIDAINAAQPDILWIGLGVPLEQQFAVRNRHRFRGVGLIKTAGGLFDVLSGVKPRAPQWLIDAGFEWAYRWYLEPKRLSVRYLTTNPHALYLLLTRTGE